MQFNKAFYEKHGIKVTNEPINDNKSLEQTRLEQALLDAVQNKPVNYATVKSVEQAVEKYPDSEALKNYLYVAYSKTHQFDKALDCLFTTIKKHPDYAFGLVNLVNHYLHRKDLASAAKWLTEPYDVRRVEKEDFIHVSVFISYYQAVVRLALAKNDIKTAEKYHRLMFDYDPKDETVNQLRDEILNGRITAMNARMLPADERTVEATPKAILGWEASDKAPVFTHPEVHQLYTLPADENMPQALIKTLLALPRETFIQDLENVLADMVRRRDYYSTLTEWDEHTMSFPIHALKFLTELRAYDSLPTILNILRQDEEFLELWFSMELHDYFYPCIYFLGNTQLPLLQAFALELYNFNWARTVATDLVTQVALRQPERRGEALDWFRTVMQTHLNQPKNDGLIDSTFISSMVGDAINCGLVELEPEIVALYEKGWIEDGMSGDLEEIKASLHKPDAHLGRYEPLPVSIQEMYAGRYSDKMAERAYDPTKMQERVKDPYDDFLTERAFQQINAKQSGKYYDDDDDDDNEYYRPPQETVKRVEPKVGRNDPCPCGSGKKYKKCHGA